MSDELFSVAKSSFLNAEDFADCLVAFIATDEPEEREGDNGGTYEIVRGQLLLIDGKPSENAGIGSTQKLPYLIEEFGMMGAWLVGSAKKTLKTGKPVVGRVTGFKNKKRTTSYKLEEPSDADLKLVTPAVRTELKKMIEAAQPFES